MAHFYDLLICVFKRSNHLILENLKSYILDEHGETIADRDKKQQKVNGKTKSFN